MNYIAKQSDLVGVWELVKYTTVPDHSSVVLYPYGENSKGYIIYTIEGFVSVHIMRSNRILKNSPTKEKIEASENFGGYVGRYIVSGNTVTHYPEVTGFLSYIQKPQIRHFQISGNLLTLDYRHPFEEHSLIQTSKTKARSELTWERVLR